MRFIYTLPFLIAAWFATTAAVQAEDTVEDKDTKVSFPSTVSFQVDGKDVQLKATGVSTRTKFIVKVYSVASYMQDPPSGGDKEAIFKEIIADNRPKQLTQQWLYAIDLDKLKEGFHDSFQKVMTDEQRQKLQKEIDQFLGFYDKAPAVKDQHVIRRLPGGTIELYINGDKKGSLTNPEFAEALWSIWFGPKSSVNRNRLIDKL